MKLKNLADAAVAAVDKKLQRFDPKWQARNGTAAGIRTRPASPAIGSGAA